MLVCMEDIVAVEVGLDTGESRFFLTWGRIQHRVFESFFEMCQRPISYGTGYEAWRKRMLRRMREGKEMWYLGHYEVDEPLDGWDAGEGSGNGTRRGEYSDRSVD